MRSNRYIVSLIIVAFFSVNIFAKEKINLNFKDLEITTLIKAVSKTLDKNILMEKDIKGKVGFIANKAVYKEDLLKILVYTLESKGYTIIEKGDILRVVRLNDAAKYNTPIYNNSKNLLTNEMVTEVFDIDNVNVDYISSKVRHLISKSAKLVTDKESNTVILTDFIPNIQTVKKVISMISIDSKKTIEVIELKNIQGSSILADLKAVAKAVFNEKIIKEKVAILLNKDSNAIMFVGKKENVAYMTNYLTQVDKKGSLVEKVVVVIPLKNAESKNIIKMITSIITNKKYKDPNNKPFASSDDESNSIILMGPKEEIKYFTSLLEQLDVDKQQVYVQARIIEISEKKTRDVGFKYGLDGFGAGSDGLLNFSSQLNGSGAAGTIPLASLSSYGYDLSSMKNGLSLGMSLNLLNQNGAADIVSEPSLLCINNKESSIYVGQTISIKTGTTTTTGGIPTDTYKREDVGLTLKVKPRISNGDKVLLEINTKLEDVDQTVTSSGNADTSKKELLTSAIVNNGESIILGGYIRAKTENTVDKIPFFGDIPLLGGLFRNTREVNDKINLVIIITPYIVPKSEDLTYVRNQLAELKLLEDKYTKDTILRLDKMKLKAKKQDLKRAENRIELDEEKRDLKDDMIDFSEDKKDYEDDKKEELNEKLDDDEKLHNQRVKDMFGI
ncbi:MAG: secretin N-terminal domain-containing protein [Campylobacterota bacterium]|nr:secretin N-terminal domain-containing protein [Campylobacterota bacterium]